MSKQFCFKQFSLAWVRCVNVKTILFQAIQFSMSTQFCFIWPKDRTLSGATTPGQSGLWSDGNKVLLRIPQSYSITGTSSSVCCASYPGYSLGGGLMPLQRCSICILQSQSTEQGTIWLSRNDWIMLKRIISVW